MGFSDMARSIPKVWDKYTLRGIEPSVLSVLPVFIYGTAWKEERTADLVYSAINAGFRAVDTAAQPRHYQEHLVGEGIRKAIADNIVRREELYVRHVAVHQVSGKRKSGSSGPMLVLTPRLDSNQIQPCSGTGS